MPAVAAVLAAATLASALMVGAASLIQHNKDIYRWQLNLHQASLELTAPDRSRPVEPGTPPARKDVDPVSVAATLRGTLDTVSSAVALNWIALPDCIKPRSTPPLPTRTRTAAAISSGFRQPTAVP